MKENQYAFIESLVDLIEEHMKDDIDLDLVSKEPFHFERVDLKFLS